MRPSVPPRRMGVYSSASATLAVANGLRGSKPNSANLHAAHKNPASRGTKKPVLKGCLHRGHAVSWYKMRLVFVARRRAPYRTSRALHFASTSADTCTHRFDPRCREP